MKRVLITGATGNIGFETIEYLSKFNDECKIFAGVRNIDKSRQVFSKFNNIEFVPFDFENPETFENALNNMDCVFLLRPPHISDVNKYFKPLINKIKDNGINEIVFLSVQGVEKSSVIPHHKIEKLIKANGFDYIFLRPSYFMQNLTTALLSDIKQKMKIVLPAGKAKFNWIDVKNIGEVAAILIKDFATYKNQEFDLTGYENENFYTVADLISKTINKTIGYDNANPLRFFWIKKREKLSTGMIVVMIVLHFSPRFQNEPEVSNLYEKLTTKKPTTLKEFIDREKEKIT